MILYFKNSGNRFASRESKREIPRKKNLVHVHNFTCLRSSRGTCIRLTSFFPSSQVMVNIQWFKNNIEGKSKIIKKKSVLCILQLRDGLLCMVFMVYNDWWLWLFHTRPVLSLFDQYLMLQRVLAKNAWDYLLWPPSHRESISNFNF